MLSPADFTFIASNVVDNVIRKGDKGATLFRLHIIISCEIGGGGVRYVTITLFRGLALANRINVIETISQRVRTYRRSRAKYNERIIYSR